MGLFDWVEAGFLADKGADPESGAAESFEELFPGAFSIVMGDSLTSIFPGGQQAHIYGDSIQYTVDWEGILIDGILGDIPHVGEFLEGGVGGAITGLVTGVGGYVNFVYGRNIGAVYGPSTAVQRGPTTTITGKNWLFREHGHAAATPTMFLPTAPAAGSPEEALQSKYDTIVQVIVTILSAIMILVGFVSELLASQWFKAKDPTAADDDQPAHTNPFVNSILKLTSWSVTNRLMAIILLVERMGEEARKGVFKVPTVEEQLAQAKTDTAANALSISTVRSDLEARLDAAEKAATKAASDFGQALDLLDQSLAKLRGGVTAAQSSADAAQQTADQTHLTVTDWGVAADQNVYVRAASGDAEVTALGDDGNVRLDAGNIVSARSGKAKLILYNGEAGGNATLLGEGEGSVMLSAGEIGLGAYIDMTAEELTIRLGAIDVGPTITMTEESLTLQVGPPGSGASITLTPESITMKVAEAVSTISPEGITEELAEVTRELSPEGHSFTAAEAVESIGVTGFAKEGPTGASELEASDEENATLKDVTVDATLAQEMGLGDFV